MQGLSLPELALWVHILAHFLPCISSFPVMSSLRGQFQTVQGEYILKLNKEACATN